MGNTKEEEALRILSRLSPAEKEVYGGLRDALVEQANESQRVLDETFAELKSGLEELRERLTRLEKKQQIKPFSVPSWVGADETKQNQYRAIQTKLEGDIGTAKRPKDISQAFIDAAKSQQELLAVNRPLIVLDKKIMIASALGSALSGVLAAIVIKAIAPSSDHKGSTATQNKAQDWKKQQAAENYLRRMEADTTRQEARLDAIDAADRPMPN